MNNNPLVSVFMPAYNHEEFVGLAIKSLLDQNYDNIEFIIINDGSTDETHQQIMKYYDVCKKKFQKFTYINRKNIGLLNTLKEMESLLSGKYLTILYSDDIFINDRIVKQVNALELNPDYALCYGKMIGINKNNEEIKKYKTKHTASGNVFAKLLKRNFIPAPAVMFKIEILLNLGGYDTSFEYDDYPLWLKIAHKNKILFLDEYLVKYRTHDNNLSNDLLKTITNVEKILDTWKKEKEYNKVIKSFYRKSFYELAKRNEFKSEAKIYMLKSLKSWYDPRFIKSVFRLYFT